MAFVSGVGNGSVAIKNVHAGGTAEPDITLIVLNNVIKLAKILGGIEPYHFQLEFRVYDFKACILPTGYACKKQYKTHNDVLSEGQINAVYTKIAYLTYPAFIKNN